MARSDLLLNVVNAARQGDQVLLRKFVEALIAEERAQKHHVLADRLEQALRRNGATSNGSASPGASRDVAQLVSERVPHRPLETLSLSSAVQGAVAEFLEEHRRSDLLKSYNLAPRHRLMFVGPPGNGKTTLAEAIAYELMIPFYVARYEGLIGSFLGETANRVSQLFDWVRSRNCVLFFDEFDVIAKERGDVHETGEIKRVVSSLLLQMDSLPPHVVVITATNHGDLLDVAAWRRFELRLRLDPPNERERGVFASALLGRLEQPLGITATTLGRELKGLSYAEVEDFCGDVIRKYVLSLPNASLRKILRSCLDQWAQRAKPSRAGARSKR